MNFFGFGASPSADQPKQSSQRSEEPEQPDQAAPDPIQIGQAGWTILHTTAAAYPYKPSQEQRRAMQTFLESWSVVYPCSWCSVHMRKYLRDHSLEENKSSSSNGKSSSGSSRGETFTDPLKGKEEASKYVCLMHNEVNRRLGKDEFDCTPDAVLKRWHPTYPEMSDPPVTTTTPSNGASHSSGGGGSPIPSTGVSVGGSSSSTNHNTSSSSFAAGGTSAGGNKSSSTSPISGTGWSNMKPREKDKDTDPDEVLKHLQGCMAFCPDEEKKKRFS